MGGVCLSIRPTFQGFLYLAHPPLADDPGQEQQTARRGRDKTFISSENKGTKAGVVGVFGDSPVMCLSVNCVAPPEAGSPVRSKINTDNTFSI